MGKSISGMKKKQQTIKSLWKKKKVEFFSIVDPD